ncbi:DNA-binding domain-containing protein [Ferrimonas senticii]|uniref:HvfC family RiPP maturation protein n=1 Tax=Ferrimonas senticii TaxID=394566 RepID=UPI00040511E1|nr:putative DNA-binding domain-containing protein [Ferrimonas senticii]
MSELRQMQQQFMSHIRAQQQQPAPLGLEARRMNIYRELMFNNVSGFVDAAFPVLRSLLATDLWQGLLRQFFAEHDCSSPLFVDISAEFVRFLNGAQGLPDYAVALADYEQLELRIDTLPEITDQPLLSEPEQLFRSQLQLYGAAYLAQYPYPVHQIGQHNSQPEPQPTYLLVYRDLDDDVAFMALNPLSARLLNQLAEQPGQTAEQLIEAMLPSLPELEPAQIAQGAGQLLLDLAAKGIVRGNSV